MDGLGGGPGEMEGLDGPPGQGPALTYGICPLAWKASVPGWLLPGLLTAVAL